MIYTCWAKANVMSESSRPVFESHLSLVSLQWKHDVIGVQSVSHRDRGARLSSSFLNGKLGGCCIASNYKSRLCSIFGRTENTTRQAGRTRPRRDRGVFPFSLSSCFFFFVAPEVISISP